MIIELLGASNYISYNIKIMELFGLHAAIYLSELLNINEKALRKTKIDENNYFTIDRKYIEKRTTIKASEQIEIDKTFQEIGLLKCNEQDQNIVTIDLAVLLTIMSEGKEVIKEIKTVFEKVSKPKKTKSEAIKNNLKNSIETTNEELYNAYCEWIDAVYAKQGWMSLKSVKVAQQEIDQFSLRKLDVALKILEIATIRGYREMYWAIKIYKENYEPTFKLEETKQELADRNNQNLSKEVF